MALKLMHKEEPNLSLNKWFLFILADQLLSTFQRLLYPFIYTGKAIQPRGTKNKLKINIPRHSHPS